MHECVAPHHSQLRPLTGRQQPLADTSFSSTVGSGVRDLGAGASASWLAGERLFLQHGPINLIVRAEGEAQAVDYAYHELCTEFPTWLSELAAQLPRLRMAESKRLAIPEGAVARRMVTAVRATHAEFVTPMAAVAGAVADHAIALLARHAGVTRAWVNNGGDIALHLTPSTYVDIAVVPSLQHAGAAASLRIAESTSVRGIATSGWQGRSQSLGIADAVTVLAASAALADAAATLIANAVNAQHPHIVRAPANTLDEDSDLGTREVTVEVGVLDQDTIHRALKSGQTVAQDLCARGIINSAALLLQRSWLSVDGPSENSPAITWLGSDNIGAPN